jgi:4-hydroxybenzoate polyprenyltransferase
MNETTILDQNSRSFLVRFYIYQKERFPFLAHGILIAAFSFSAVSYSRICRGAPGFIDTKVFLAGVFITITLFFLVRIFDEFKDREDDARFRKYLPVPRGLISFPELRTVGIIAVVLQVIVNAWFFPKMLYLHAVVIGYLLLMGVEFFVPEWLKKRQMLYVISHMFIIPLVDIYASGLDWLLAGVSAPFGLIFFFAVSYMNGIVLEFGRKIRPTEKEEPGVITYSALYGPKRAAYYWILCLFITLLFSVAASWYAGFSWIAYAVLGFFFILCAIPGILFIRNRGVKLSKWIEYSSALWTITMYLTLGAAPMLHKLIFG